MIRLKIIFSGGFFSVTLKEYNLLINDDLIPYSIIIYRRKIIIMIYYINKCIRLFKIMKYYCSHTPSRR